MNAQHPIPASLQSFHAEDIHSQSELFFLTNNPTTSSYLLDFISLNCPVVISEAIAANRNTSKETLERLASHYNPKVRAAIAENSSAPFEILSMLCEDGDPDIRFAMAENFNLPKSLLAKLVNDENPYVASRACTTIERLRQDLNKTRTS